KYCGRRNLTRTSRPSSRGLVEALAHIVENVAPPIRMLVRCPIQRRAQLRQMPAVAALPVVLVRSPMMRTASRPVLEMLHGAFDRLARLLRVARARDLFGYFGHRARYQGVDQLFRRFR